MLSLITGGTTKAWKENWLATKIAAIDLGTYKEFKTTLTKAFTPIDEGGYARAALKIVFKSLVWSGLRRLKSCQDWTELLKTGLHWLVLVFLRLQDQS